MHSMAAMIQTPAGTRYADGHSGHREACSVCRQTGSTGAGQGVEPQAPRGSRRPASVQTRNATVASPGHADKSGFLPPGRDIRFHVAFRRDTGDLVFEVRDHRTGETIRQFPPEALLDAGQKLEDLRGILVDERA